MDHIGRIYATVTRPFCTVSLNNNTLGSDSFSYTSSATVRQDGDGSPVKGMGEGYGMMTQ
jgi:hypothetical protein